MKVVILCGGKGTRIRDVAEEMPKPMIPIGTSPIVCHVMSIYSAHNFNEFILCLGYRGWKIKEYFLNYKAETTDFEIDLGKGSKLQYIGTNYLPPWKIIFANTGLNAMTGSRIKQIQKYVGEHPFMLTYGDGVGDVDINALLEFHKSHGKLVTLTSVRPPSRFGTLLIEGDKVKAFEEKPQTVQGHINGGFMVCNPGVFDYVDFKEDCIFEREPLQNLATDGELRSFYHDGFWMPMDTYREYLLLNELWNTGNAPWLSTHMKSDT